MICFGHIAGARKPLLLFTLFLIVFPVFSSATECSFDFGSKGGFVYKDKDRNIPFQDFNFFIENKLKDSSLLGLKVKYSKVNFDTEFLNTQFASVKEIVSYKRDAFSFRGGFVGYFFKNAVSIKVDGYRFSLKMQDNAAVFGRFGFHSEKIDFGVRIGGLYSKPKFDVSDLCLFNGKPVDSSVIMVMGGLDFPKQHYLDICHIGLSFGVETSKNSYLGNASLNLNAACIRKHIKYFDICFGVLNLIAKSNLKIGEKDVNSLFVRFKRANADLSFSDIAVFGACRFNWMSRYFGTDLTISYFHCVKADNSLYYSASMRKLFWWEEVAGQVSIIDMKKIGLLAGRVRLNFKIGAVNLFVSKIIPVVIDFGNTSGGSGKKPDSDIIKTALLSGTFVGLNIKI